MTTIQNQEFGGERPLFGSKNLRLEDVTFHAGESALKRCCDIEAVRCVFEGKYPFWHVCGFAVENCTFTPGARAALWYSCNCRMTDSRVDAPKMFRQVEGITLQRVSFTDAQETLWHCSCVHGTDVELVNADYVFMHGTDIFLDRYRQNGNYSFQYCRNVHIRHAVIYSKDAFWETDNVTVEDSELHGEYLGWHSKNLRLVRCRISGTQPLCYCRNLELVDCIFDPDCDLAFEESEVRGNSLSPITSVKNPATGHLEAPEIGELILDGNAPAPADCKIVVPAKA